MLVIIGFASGYLKFTFLSLSVGWDTIEGYITPWLVVGTSQYTAEPQCKDSVDRSIILASVSQNPFWCPQAGPLFQAGNVETR